MYTDTDSLIYHIECDDVYALSINTSDYAIDNVYDILLVK